MLIAAGLSSEPSASGGAFSSKALGASPTAGVDEEGVGGAEAAGTSGAAFGAAWNVGAG